MGNFYRVSADNRDLNYDKYFTQGDSERSTLNEFNSNNAARLDIGSIKKKLMSLQYIRDELANWKEAKP